MVNVCVIVQHMGSEIKHKAGKITKGKVTKMNKNTKIEIEVIKAVDGYDYFLSNPCFTEYNIHNENDLIDELLKALKICRKIENKKKGEV